MFSLYRIKTIRGFIYLYEKDLEMPEWATGLLQSSGITLLKHYYLFSLHKL
jgi:hypothetical protein